MICIIALKFNINIIQTMKKFSLTLLFAAAAVIGISTTGCGGDETPVNPKPTDTTETGNETQVANSVRVGLKDFSIVTETERTFGSYSTGKNETGVIVFGQDSKNGDIDFQITFPGKTAGTYITSETGANSLVFALGTGTAGDLRRQEHEASTTILTVTVTEYGSVGGKIKGTFSGQVKNASGQIVNITKGIFEVIRKADTI